MPTILISAPYMLPLVERLPPTVRPLRLDLIIAPVRSPGRSDQILSFAGPVRRRPWLATTRYTARALSALRSAPEGHLSGHRIDSIDSEECARLGIKVGRTPNAFTLPVADTVLGYMLAFARRQPWMDRVMKDGVWNQAAGTFAERCSLGVVGVGRIGKAVIRGRELSVCAAG